MSYFLKFLAWIIPNDPYPYTRDPPRREILSLGGGWRTALSLFMDNQDWYLAGGHLGIDRTAEQNGYKQRMIPHF